MKKARRNQKLDQGASLGEQTFTGVDAQPKSPTVSIEKTAIPAALARAVATAAIAFRIPTKNI